MAFKESEAGTKWCPMVRHEGNEGGSFSRGTRNSNPTNGGDKDDFYRCNCIGSACAMWVYTAGPRLENRVSIGCSRAGDFLGDDVSHISQLRYGDDPSAYHAAAKAYLEQAVQNPLLQNVEDGWVFKSIEFDEDELRITQISTREKDPNAMGRCGLSRE